MRGKAVATKKKPVVIGITPAYAGKSALQASLWCLPADHPRLCGEKHLLSTIKLYHTGSPPPMRGKDAAGAFRAAAPGITPAYAGKSQSRQV